MPCWLIKSEADVYSIDALRRDKTTLWTGVRNYQARNYLCQMKPGDQVLLYHSNSEPLAIVGIAEVKKAAIPDPLQFDSKSEYYDPKAGKDKPRWYAPELRFKEKFRAPITREMLQNTPALKNMLLLKKGSRLSVQPVSEAEFKAVLAQNE